MNSRTFFEKIERLAHETRGHRLRLLPSRLAHPYHPGESLDIRGYNQFDSYSCGAVAGYMILKAFKPKASFAEFYQRCSPSPENGLSETRLVQALRRSGVGLGKRAKGMSFEEIRNAIGQGFPILSVLDCPGEDCAHWVVVYGYDMIGGSGRAKQVYVANYNFFGINARFRGGQNPLEYTKYAALVRSYTPYVCWGK